MQAKNAAEALTISSSVMHSNGQLVAHVLAQKASHVSPIER